MKNDPRMTIIPPNQVEDTRVSGSKRADMLARSAAPFGNTFVARVRWRSAQRMVEAYTGFIQSVRQAEEELDNLDWAMFKRQQTANFLQNEAERWHAHEAHQRGALYARSEREYKDEMLRSKLRDWEREREEEEARDYQEEWQRNRQSPRSAKPSSPHQSQEQSEADAQFNGIAEAAKARHKVQRAIDEMLEGRTEAEASDGEKMVFAQMRADVEQMISDRGWV